MDPKFNYQPFLGNRNDLPPLLSNRQQLQAGGDEETMLDLGWIFAVFRRRAPVMILLAIALIGIFGGLIVRSAKRVVPVYQGSFTLLVEPISAEARLAQQYVTAQPSGAELSKIRVEDTTLLDYETQIRVLKSPKLINKVVENVRKEYPETSYDSIYDRLNISRVTFKKDGKLAGTKILIITYKGLDANKVEAVLEELKEVYLKYSLESRLIKINQGIEFIEKLIPQLNNNVELLEKRIQGLREEYDFFEPKVTANMLYDQKLGLERKQFDLESELSQIRELYSHLQREIIKGNHLSVLGESLGLNETLIIEIQKLEGQIALESTIFLEDSVPIRNLRRKRESLMAIAERQSQAVAEKLGGQIKQLEAQQKTIAEQRSMLERKIQELPNVTREYNQLQLELAVATDSLTEFLTKLEALKLDAAQQREPWELIKPPEIPRDSSGKPISVTVTETKRQIATAAILSILVSIAAGFFVEVLITVFHTPEELKAATKLPLLGVIPFAKELKKTVKPSHKKTAVAALPGLGPIAGESLVFGIQGKKARSYNASPLLEAFRSLYTNIRLLSYDGSIHSLVIGSTATGDGKSTVAMHLAQTAATIGQRVLLVDADLRSPKLHQKLDIPNLRGLSDVIGTDLSLNDAIQRSPQDDNLFVLTSGPLPDDPIKLLSSKKMYSLMEQFQDFFDLVIYDTPPLVGLADGNFLAAQTDGIVLVTRLAKTDRSLVQKSLEGLKISGAKVLGVVANGLKA